MPKKIFSSISTLLIVFENITIFYLLFLLASDLEKIFVWIVNSNKLVILMVVSLRKLLGFSEKSLESSLLAV